MNKAFKYELFNIDWRFANHTPNMLFKTRMMMAQEVNNSEDAQLRKGKLNDTKLTVGDIRSGEMARVVDSDIGYTVLE